MVEVLTGIFVLTAEKTSSDSSANYMDVGCFPITDLCIPWLWHVGTSLTALLLLLITMLLTENWYCQLVILGVQVKISFDPILFLGFGMFVLPGYCVTTVY